MVFQYRYTLNNQFKCIYPLKYFSFLYGENTQNSFF
jgi:hypothetical protein